VERLGFFLSDIKHPVFLPTHIENRMRGSNYVTVNLEDEWKRDTGMLVVTNTGF